MFDLRQSWFRDVSVLEISGLPEIGNFEQSSHGIWFAKQKFRIQVTLKLSKNFVLM